VYQIGWFSTGRDKAARDLLLTVCSKIESGELKVDIPFVFSNREPGENSESDSFFSLVSEHGFPLIHLSSGSFRGEDNTFLSPQWRLDYDREAMNRLQGYVTDICILAGYMLIVGPEMCRRYTMVNLHPAAPGGPQGTWQEVIWQLIETQADETGVMMHLVTPELDKGPPVAYCTFPIRGNQFDRYWNEIEGRSIEKIKYDEGENNPLFKLIREYGLAREFPLITTTIKAFCEERIRIERGEVLSASGELISGYNLTREIDNALKGGNNEIYLL